MGSAYKFTNPDGIYFVTFTIVQWIDAFIRKGYKGIIIDSLKHCQKEKELSIHAWCVMSNHMHLIISRKGEIELSDIVRDFKKFTANKILKEMFQDKESRRNWMVWIFSEAGRKNPNNKKYQFWQQDNHPIELITNKFIDQKLNYIHNNPVVAEIVDNPKDYIYSRARDYAGTKGLIDIEFLD